MNVSLRLPRMTRDWFLDGAAQQEAPYEFDGFEPVAMTGGTRRHGLICANLLLAIRTRLGDAPFQVLLETGVATVGNAVRSGGGDWVATATLGTEHLALPEVGIEIPVIEIFAGVSFD